jgi:hypothetical protein
MHLFVTHACAVSGCGLGEDAKRSTGITQRVGALEARGEGKLS